jgi:hypothetical protein
MTFGFEDLIQLIEVYEHTDLFHFIVCTLLGCTLVSLEYLCELFFLLLSCS